AVRSALTCLQSTRGHGHCRRSVRSVDKPDSKGSPHMPGWSPPEGVPMDTVLFLGFSAAYLVLLAWGIVLVVRRRRVIVSDVALLVFAALVYDNAVLGLGSFVGEGAGLETANAARYWLHALVTPLLVLVAWNVLV